MNSRNRIIRWINDFVLLQNPDKDCGSMLLEQQPMKVAEALLLFLKGEGHFTHLSILEISKKRAKAVAHQQDMLGKIKAKFYVW